MIASQIRQANSQLLRIGNKTPTLPPAYTRQTAPSRRCVQKSLPGRIEMPKQDQSRGGVIQFH